MEQMFEKASRQKIRFETSKGLLTVEDLWELPLTAQNGRLCLDDIARSLHNQLKDSEEISFVTPAKTSDGSLTLAFDIVKHVIATKLTEAEARRNEQDAREKKQKIMAIIDQKKDQALSEMSVEELSKLVDSI